MSTLATFRQTRLNVDLGLDLSTDTTGDTDTSMGSVTVRNQAIKTALARLWPRMGRLIEESVTPTTTDTEYALSTIRDVETVDFIGATSGTPIDKGNNFRHLWVETDSSIPVSRLRLPAAPGSANYSTLRVIGYVPYKSELTGDSDTLDLPVEFEWVAAVGARAECYRRMANERINYERFNGMNRDNDVTSNEMLTFYQVASREFDDAIEAHRRSFVTGHTWRG